ncbi:nuclear transport factor 2 family protein [Rhizobium bangladeshense]|uniref:Nuclear transport factor 2 family protein n=2 Tax=Rhizobium bangladeshense TaxID=1138189 RepID=A0ABS7LM49_9HYPH|nr:nuclear transport factor 2 family protein [Rhizobium bangladeshense]
MSTLVLASKEAFIREMFDAVDRQDAAAFVAFLTDNVSFRFGNMPILVGREAVKEGSDAFYNCIRSLKHEYLQFFDNGDSWIVEQTVHYVDRWGRDHSLPCVNVLRFTDGKVSDYRIYMNNSPLFIPPAT